ncbi:hypothetical protein, partial [Corynebacterium coyleae]|uniref:hypothetical protein n=1 Tax=Corynebacterium coyleae TaxID=53374 RepID=UPI00254E41BD
VARIGGGDTGNGHGGSQCCCDGVADCVSHWWCSLVISCFADQDLFFLTRLRLCSLYAQVKRLLDTLIFGGIVQRFFRIVQRFHPG